MSKDSTPKLPSVIRDGCGTTAGYNYHRYKNEITCQICRNAHALRRKESRRSNPVIREKHRANSHEWYRLNKEKRKKYIKERTLCPESREKVRLSATKFRAGNKEKIRTWGRDWKKRNPDKVRRQSARRRARERDNGFEVYSEVQVLNLYGTNCYSCHEPIDLSAPRGTRFNGWEKGLHIDHLISIADGGPDTLENVRPSHGLCNLIKGR